MGPSEPALGIEPSFPPYESGASPFRLCGRAAPGEGIEPPFYKLTAWRPAFRRPWKKKWRPPVRTRPFHDQNRNGCLPLREAAWLADFLNARCSSPVRRGSITMAHAFPAFRLARMSGTPTLRGAFHPFSSGCQRAWFQFPEMGSNHRSRCQKTLSCHWTIRECLSGSEGS
jgi:hypothetical protein